MKKLLLLALTSGTLFSMESNIHKKLDIEMFRSLEQERDRVAHDLAVIRAYKLQNQIAQQYAAEPTHTNNAKEQRASLLLKDHQHIRCSIKDTTHANTAGPITYDPIWYRKQTVTRLASASPLLYGIARRTRHETFVRRNVSEVLANNFSCLANQEDDLFKKLKEHQDIISMHQLLSK